MFEGSQILGVLAAVLLAIALTAWFKIMRVSGPDRMGGKGAASGARIETASRLLVVALGVSAIAAFLALVGLFSN
jgi:hypothetical protein